MRKKFILPLVLLQAMTAVNAQQAMTNTSTPLLQPATAINEPGSFGAGLMLGEPMGLTMKYRFLEKFAVDAGVGYSFVDPSGCQLHSDLLYQPFELYRSEEGVLSFYFGVGGRVKFVDNQDNIAGLRWPVGLAYALGRHPIEIFAEVAPCLDLAPSTDLSWNGMIGVRFYFH